MLLFLLFQRVWDQLYLTPLRVTGHDDRIGAYLGTLGFTKPLEQLMLHTVPLHRLLDWLSEPQGPNLVETSETVAPYKALAIAVTKRTLYEEKPPRVGVGLMYKPHISTVPFSVAYIPRGVREAIGCTTPPIHEPLRDEQCHTCRGTTSRLAGLGIGRQWKALLGLGLTTLSEALGSTRPGRSLQQGA